MSKISTWSGVDTAESGSDPKYGRPDPDPHERLIPGPGGKKSFKTHKKCFLSLSN